jgi:hypothetical protein
MQTPWLTSQTAPSSPSAAQSGSLSHCALGGLPYVKLQPSERSQPAASDRRMGQKLPMTRRLPAPSSTETLEASLLPALSVK